MRSIFLFGKWVGIIFLGMLACTAIWWGSTKIITTRLNIHGQDGQHVSLSMPLRDRENLYYFFKNAMIFESGGYVLLGNKPMWMGGYITPFTTTSWYNFLDSVSPTNIRKYYGWKTWKKYQHFFPTTHFIFLEEENPFWPKPHSSVSIIFINKSNLQKIIDVHLDDFQAVLGKKEISAEQLLQEAKKSPFLKIVLRKHEGLIGTVFGFGRNNAWLFKAKEEGEPVVLNTFWEQEMYDLIDKRHEDTWWGFGIFPSSLKESVGYPWFAADPTTAESQQLREDFLKTREKIIDYYQGKDFLEATLSLLLEK